MKVLITFLMIANALDGSAQPSTKRMIYLFYQTDGAAMATQQRLVLEQDSKGWKERDLELKQVYIQKDPQTASRWHIGERTSFTFILIGKDGQEKLRSDTVVTRQRLYALIDAMPMRQEEQKKQKD